MGKDNQSLTSTEASSPAIVDRWGGQLWEPFSRLRTEIDRLFGDFGDRSLAGNIGRRLSEFAGPALELKESDGEYRLNVEVPGMKADEIDIRVSDGILRVKGEHKEEKEEKDKGYLFSERHYGSFERAIELPKSIDSDKISAECKDGLLTVHLPKSGEALKHEHKIAITAR